MFQLFFKTFLPFRLYIFIHGCRKSMIRRVPGNTARQTRDFVKQHIQHLNEHLKIKPSKILILANSWNIVNNYSDSIPILTKTDTIFNYVNKNIVPILNQNISKQQVLADTENVMKFQYNSSLNVLSFHEMTKVINKNIYKLPLNDKYRPSGNPTYHVKSLLGFFDHLEKNGINPTKYKDYISTKLSAGVNCTEDYLEQQQHLLSVYKVYEHDICRTENICTSMKYYGLILEFIKNNNYNINDDIFNFLHVNQSISNIIIPNYKEWMYLEQQLYKNIFHQLQNNINDTINVQCNNICHYVYGTWKEAKIDKCIREPRILKIEDLKHKGEVDPSNSTTASPTTINHTIYCNNNDEISDVYNTIQELFAKEQRYNRQLKIAVVTSRANDEKILQKLFRIKNSRLKRYSNYDTRKEIELIHHGHSNVPLYHDVCIRALSGYLDTIKSKYADPQSLINTLIAFPEINFETISIALKTSRDIDMPLEDVIRNNEKFKDVIQRIDHGRSVYQEYSRKLNKAAVEIVDTKYPKEKLGYDLKHKNKLLIHLAKDFMIDRGWDEEKLTEKEINNIDDFFKNVISQKSSNILLNNSPTSLYSEYAYNLNQNMKYKYNTLDPFETNIVDLYRKHDFLTNHCEWKEYDHVFFLSFANKRGYPEGMFRSQFRFPNIFIPNNTDDGPINYEYVDVLDTESNMYKLEETVNMRKERSDANQEQQFEEFSNKVLKNTNIKCINTSNATEYYGLKTKQEPSTWLGRVRNVNMSDKNLISFESHVFQKEKNTMDDAISLPSFNNVKKRIDLFQVFFQKSKRNTNPIDDATKRIARRLQDNNHSTFAGDFLPLHDGGKITQQLLHYGRNVQKHMSHAQLQKYERCPKEYMYRYVLNVPEDAPTPLMIYGSVIHDTMERFWELRNKCINEPMPFDEVLERCTDIFKASWKRETMQSKHMFVDRQSDILEMQGVKGIQLFIKRYHQEPLPQDVEKQFVLPIPGYPSIYFRGTIDLIDHVGNIVEFKSNKLSSIAGINAIKRMARNSLQPRLYALTLSDEGKNVYMEGVENGERVLVEIARDKNDSMDRIVETLKKIKKGEFPAKPSHFTCAFCSYKRLCTEHSLKNII